MYGAALATLFAYIAMAVTLYIISRKIYPIEYEFVRLGKIILCTIIIYGSFELLDYNSGLFRCGLLVLWLVGLWGVGFFYKGEIQRLKKLVIKN